MNLSTFLESSTIHGSDSFSLESKINILFRQAILAKVNVYLKDRGMITRYKRALKAPNLLDGSYQGHVYGLIKILLNEFISSLESLDNVRHASFAKHRGRDGFTVHITFATNELANYFVQVTSDRELDSSIHGLPLVWYGSSGARINFSYSGSEFFHYLNSNFFTYKDLHEAFNSLVTDVTRVTNANLEIESNEADSIIQAPPVSPP